MNAFTTILKTELKLSLRQGDLPFFGILFPIGIMLLVGFVSKPEAIAAGFGGIAAVGICATGIMGLPLSFAAYRHAKILKRFQVTPVSPVVLLAANAMVQFSFCVVSALAVYLIAASVFGMRMEGSPVRYALTFLFVQTCLYGIGFLISSVVPNVRTANLVCTIVYFPMLFLSGATVPYEILPRGLRVVSDIFPLTQGIKLLKGAVLGLPPENGMIPFIVLAAVGVISYIVAFVTFRWE